MDIYKILCIHCNDFKRFQSPRRLQTNALVTKRRRTSRALQGLPSPSTKVTLEQERRTREEILGIPQTNKLALYSSERAQGTGHLLVLEPLQTYKQVPIKKPKRETTQMKDEPPNLSLIQVDLVPMPQGRHSYRGGPLIALVMTRAIHVAYLAMGFSPLHKWANVCQVQQIQVSFRTNKNQNARCQRPGCSFPTYPSLIFVYLFGLLARGS